MVAIYQTTWSHILTNSNFHSHCRESRVGDSGLHLCEHHSLIPRGITKTAKVFYKDAISRVHFEVGFRGANICTRIASIITAIHMVKITVKIIATFHI
jgi:hypothetical protein